MERAYVCQRTEGSKPKSLRFIIFRCHPPRRPRKFRPPIYPTNPQDSFFKTLSKFHVPLKTARWFILLIWLADTPLLLPPPTHVFCPRTRDFFICHLPHSFFGRHGTFCALGWHFLFLFLGTLVFVSSWPFLGLRIKVTRSFFLLVR